MISRFIDKSSLSIYNHQHEQNIQNIPVKYVIEARLKGDRSYEEKYRTNIRKGHVLLYVLHIGNLKYDVS